METWSSFHQNFQEIKLQNAIIYGIEYDQDTSILITVTDYGHINLHHISDLQRCTSKTLIHDNLPIYCSYFYQSRSKKILFTGGNDIIGWDWDNLRICQHNATPEGKIYRCGNFSSRIVSEIYCLTGNTELGHLYAAGSEGVIYCYDIESGQELHVYAGHSSFIHSLYYQPSTSLLFSCDETVTVCVWDTRISAGNCPLLTSQRKQLSKGAIATYSLSSSIISTLLVSPTSTISSLWSSSMTFEPEGNFLYLAGGYNYSTSNASTCHSGGWIASLYLVSGENKQEHSVISSTITTHPVQSICFHDSDLIIGCPVRGLKYCTTFPLEEISSAPTSSPSIFSLKSLPAFNLDTESLLIVGGSGPILDIYAVRGHRAKSLSIVV